MTEKQKKLHDFIATFITERGYSPSFAEMANHMNLKSKSGIHRMVQDLVSPRYLGDGDRLLAIW